MDSTQIIALAIAGIALPFIQEKLAGAHVEGTAAVWLNFAASVAIAVVATAIGGGFGGASLADPVAFTAFLLGKAAGTFALAQLVFHSANKAVTKVAGTA
jgi:hypothetical protein